MKAFEQQTLVNAHGSRRSPGRMTASCCKCHILSIASYALTLVRCLWKNVPRSLAQATSTPDSSKVWQTSATLCSAKSDFSATHKLWSPSTDYDAFRGWAMVLQYRDAMSMSKVQTNTWTVTKTVLTPTMVHHSTMEWDCDSVFFHAWYFSMHAKLLTGER